MLLLQVTKTRTAVSLIGVCVCVSSLCFAQEDNDGCREASFQGEQLESDSMKYDDYCYTKGTFIELRK